MELPAVSSVGGFLAPSYLALSGLGGTSNQSSSNPGRSSSPQPPSSLSGLGLSSYPSSLLGFAGPNSNSSAGLVSGNFRPYTIVDSRKSTGNEASKSAEKEDGDEHELDEDSNLPSLPLLVSIDSATSEPPQKRHRSEKRRECIGEGCSSSVSGRKLCTACQRRKKNGTLKIKEGMREGRALKPFHEQRNKSYTLQKATEMLKRIHEQLPSDIFAQLIDSVAPELRLKEAEIHRQLYDNALQTYQQLPRLSPNRPALLKAFSHGINSSKACELFGVSRQTLSHARNYKDEENPLKYLKYKQNCKRPRSGEQQQQSQEEDASDDYADSPSSSLEH